MPRALGVVVPLYNEEACCERVVTGLAEALRGRPHELLLVDNGSQDGSPELLRSLSQRLPHCRLLRLERNAGYGGGILAGLSALRTPLLGWYWGDGQVAPEVLCRAWDRLEQEGLDLVKARRVAREDGLQRAFVSAVYSRVMRHGFGLPWDDLNGCPKLMTREAWERLAPHSQDWFLDPELMLRAFELGLRVGEVDATMEARRGGASKVRGVTVVEFLHHLARWKRGWRPG